MGDFRYKAFISYSHRDERWAAWLHRALEAYRVPKRLVGSAGSCGAVPARLAPVFRDRDELSSAADLSGKIKDALVDSENLVLICSPAAAASRWVGEEIRFFRSLGKGDRIHCVIVDGDPQARADDGGCFPPALLQTDAGRVAEPLAADARKWADGKHLAKLKIISGVLGVRLDDLRRREQQRRRRVRAAAGIALLAAIALVLATVQSRMAERDARLAREAQQASAESMLAQFLEQSERLGDVADIETRKAFGEVMSGYLAQLDPADLTRESRRQLGVALAGRGVILRAEGYLDQAMEAFRNARRILQALVDELPGDAESLFELSQAEFWIGQVHLDQGQIEAAERSFHAYADVSHALHRLQPTNADWVMEAAYAQSNLGSMERHKLSSDPYLMLGFYQSALQLNLEASRLDEGFEIELAESYADLSDAWLSVCDLQQALEARQQNVALAARYFDIDPASNRLKTDYAYALSGLSWVHQQVGALDPALESLRRSVELHTELVAEDPQNLEKKFLLAYKSGRLAVLLAQANREDDAWALGQQVESDYRALMKQRDNVRVDHLVRFGAFLTGYANLARQRGAEAAADRLLEESIELLTGISAEHPNDKQVQNELATSKFYRWQHGGSAPPATMPVDSPGAGEEASNIHGCADLDIAVRMSVMAGVEEAARDFSDRLIGKGYDEPGFRKFCREQGLCAGPGE